MSDLKIPPQINNKIHQLKLLESTLGNLPSDKWHAVNYEKLVKQMQSDWQLEDFQQANMELRVEELFREICFEMDKLGFTANAIALAVNSVVYYEGGPKYCNAAEVEAVLQ